MEEGRKGGWQRLARTAMMVLPCLCALACASCGPHMTQQPSVQPYDRKLPPMPASTVPTTGGIRALTIQQSKLTTNPLPATSLNIRNGEIYYGYYCLMCHGAKGDGDGAVGESFVPKPTDLASSRVTGLTDGRLYYAMLNGVGHSPVLEETVAPDQRWLLVLYVRTFAERRAR
ncbi:MAG: cytochrome C [Armatimonadota bacterium]|nr:c-type cytochrome [bacterium]